MKGGVVCRGGGGSHAYLSCLPLPYLSATAISWHIASSKKAAASHGKPQRYAAYLPQITLGRAAPMYRRRAQWLASGGGGGDVERAQTCFPRAALAGRIVAKAATLQTDDVEGRRAEGDVVQANAGGTGVYIWRRGGGRGLPVMLNGE